MQVQEGKTARREGEEEGRGKWDLWRREEKEKEGRKGRRGRKKREMGGGSLTGGNSTYPGEQKGVGELG